MTESKNPIETKEKNIYNVLYFLTFIVFILELVYFTYQNVELIDFVAIVNLFILFYSLRRNRPWIRDHHEGTETLALMMIIVIAFRIIIINS